MSWYKFDNQALSNSGKIKFYAACAGISIIISVGVVLAPAILSSLFYSHEELVQISKEDAFEAIKNLNSPKTQYSTDYSFIDIKPLYDNCFYIISASKYDSTAGYVISDSCKE